MNGYLELPDSLEQDIAQHEHDVQRLRSGDLSPGVFKSRRVPRGVYEQRQADTFMVRVRIAGGAFTCAQARTLAALGQTFGTGRLHVTTRQDVQLHDIAIQDTPEIMRQLRAVGLSSKGGGGNTVRNVAACPYAGICPHECFDVTPWAHAVTEYLITLPGSFSLPRKYKISFSGCPADCAYAGVQDLGFVAKARDGRAGFALYGGGGMGAASRLGVLLEPFIDATDAVRAAEAVRRLFDRVGDRQNRARARLRFAVEKMGVDAFREAFREELNTVRADDVPSVVERSAEMNQTGHENVLPPALETCEGVRVLAQRQKELVAIPIFLPLGDISSETLRGLADTAETFSNERGLRTAQDQNLLIRCVRRDDLASAVRELRSVLQEDLFTPHPLQQFVACAGADTCKLGLCLSRPLARAAAEALAQAAVDPNALDAVDLRISGCPNSCGHHPIGSIGLFGSARRHAGRLVPFYQILLGARRGEGRFRFGQPAGALPAKAVPGFLTRLLQRFQDERGAGEAFTDYVDRVGVDTLAELARQCADVPSHEQAPEYYQDWGSEEPFSLAGRGPGECGAGVVDVIREELAAAHKHLDSLDTLSDPASRGEALGQALLATTRALLITRGVDTVRPEEVLHAFETHFVDTGLVAARFRDLMSAARGWVQGWRDAFKDRQADVVSLRQRVEHLFTTMDSSLQFHPEDSEAQVESADAPASRPRDERPQGAPDEPAAAAAIELDLRGITCPLNFVHAKLRLETLAAGDVLTLLLDHGEPIENVPASCRAEGYAVLEQVELDDGVWRVRIQNKV